MLWLRGIVLAAFAAVTLTWLTGFLNPFLPSPDRVTLALANLGSRHLEPAEDRFRVVLTWLDADHTGADTANVARTFTGVGGIELVRSARIVTGSGARADWRDAMKTQARTVLNDWNADLAIVGLVKKPSEVLSLWFVPQSGAGTLARGDRPYVPGRRHPRARLSSRPARTTYCHSTCCRFPAREYRGAWSDHRDRICGRQPRNSPNYSVPGLSSNPTTPQPCNSPSGTRSGPSESENLARGASRKP